MEHQLARDTISQHDLDKVAEWIAANPRLTIGRLVGEFENAWSDWLGCEHSVLVNSGSSANLLMLYTLMESGRLTTASRVVVPAVSWVTTVAPVIQLGMTPILCDCDPTNLGLDVEAFEQICRYQRPHAVVLVHVLGVPNHMDEILDIANRYDVMVLEDCCEAHGAEYRGEKVGTFGVMSTFSYYFGHHMSTIEGGMISTNDEHLYELSKSIRSHGWDRDLSGEHRDGLRDEFEIDPFSALYTFYYVGFNFRPTELNGFLGLIQLERLDETIETRNRNYAHYCRLFQDHWHMANAKSRVSAFAFGLLSYDRAKVGKILREHGVESRPLVCGSIGRQPFWIKRFGHTPLRNADRVHFDGLYIPCNQAMSTEDVEHIASLVPKELLVSLDDVGYWQDNYSIRMAPPSGRIRRVA